MSAAPQTGNDHLSAYVRCGFCGAEANQDHPMLAIGGLAICRGCAALASAIYAEPASSVSTPSRAGWVGGWPDPLALAAADRVALEVEVAFLDHVVAPIERFRLGVGSALDGADADGIAAALGYPVRHTHRAPVALPDGTTVVPVSYLDADPYSRDHPPDYGLYLDPRWAPPWPHDHLHWPDFGIPAEPLAAMAALTSLLDRARNGQCVEIGCLGGHGRTGTALACLAVLTGQPPGDAVGWVRAHYCAHAVETDGQAAFVADLPV
jgi:hypothetical protein